MPGCVWPKKGGALMLMMLGHAGLVWGLEKKLVLLTSNAWSNPCHQPNWAWLAP